MVAHPVSLALRRSVRLDYRVKPRLKTTQKGQIRSPSLRATTLLPYTCDFRVLLSCPDRPLSVNTGSLSLTEGASTSADQWKKGGFRPLFWLHRAAETFFCVPSGSVALLTYRGISHCFLGDCHPSPELPLYGRLTPGHMALI